MISVHSNTQRIQHHLNQIKMPPLIYPGPVPLMATPKKPGMTIPRHAGWHTPGRTSDKGGRAGAPRRHRCWQQARPAVPDYPTLPNPLALLFLALMETPGGCVSEQSCVGWVHKVGLTVWFRE